MIDNKKLVMARIRAEMAKGTSTSDVVEIVAEIFARQTAADEAEAIRDAPRSKKT